MGSRSILLKIKILQKRTPNSTSLEFYHHEHLGIRAKVDPFNYKAQRSVSTAYDNSFGVKAARLWKPLIPTAIPAKPFKMYQNVCMYSRTPGQK